MIALGVAPGPVHVDVVGALAVLVAGEGHVVGLVWVDAWVESQFDEWQLVRGPRLHRSHRDLDVDHRFGAEPRYRGRSDVIDPQGQVTERPADPPGLALELRRPRRVVVDQGDISCAPLPHTG